ncbi:hypothetical protein CALCODRAFT_546084 [Calocera cornea HHB12733]|uniref:Uncharacterized protein n=1 Tax=Calocera cornea HHB12733 TaxID=1353952 RepID=A0A165ES08_9BASI|nr:hypothetical protein CALCODRAFT_546084 [Calocera cornea HHB12733]
MSALRALAPQRWLSKAKQKTTKSTTTTTTTAATSAPAANAAPDTVPASAAPAADASASTTARTIKAGAFRRKDKGKAVEAAPVVIPVKVVPTPADVVEAMLGGWATQTVALSNMAANELSAVTGGPMIKAEQPEPAEGADEVQEKRAAAKGATAREREGHDELGEGGSGQRGSEEHGGEEHGSWVGKGREQQIGEGEGNSGEASCSPRELEEARPPIFIEPPVEELPSMWEMSSGEYHDALLANRRIGARSGLASQISVYGRAMGVEKYGWDWVGRIWMQSACWVPAVVAFCMGVWRTGFSLSAIWNLFWGCLFYLADIVYESIVWCIRKLWPYRQLIVAAIVFVLVLWLVFGINLVKLLEGIFKGISGWGRVNGSASTAVA